EIEGTTDADAVACSEEHGIVRTCIGSRDAKRCRERKAIQVRDHEAVDPAEHLERIARGHEIEPPASEAALPLSPSVVVVRRERVQRWILRHERTRAVPSRIGAEDAEPPYGSPEGAEQIARVRERDVGPRRVRLE